jgi:hypothetical protein
MRINHKAMTQKIEPKYPSRDTVCWDYGYKHGVMLQLKRPNKFICGYCLAQAVTEDRVPHALGCPNPERHK